MPPTKTVLLVEDQITLAEVYRVRLAAEGYQVWIATDGHAAVDLALQLSPDLILLDIMLPKMSGFDVLETLRRHPNLAQTKVIVMSALAEKVDQQRGQRLGVVNWLIKSQSTLEEAVNTIRTALDPGQQLPSPA